jgi:hypothetical protein
VTGELICKSTPTYGTGDEIGNERGCINSMSTCTFDPPLQMKTTHPIFITSSYDARESHTGVMSLFYIAVAEVDGPGRCRCTSWLLERDVLALAQDGCSCRGDLWLESRIPICAQQAKRVRDRPKRVLHLI